MSFFDTHCHLNFKAFEGGQAKIIRRALDAGVDLFVVPGTDMTTSQTAIDLAHAHEQVYALVGIHPHHIHNYLNTSHVILWQGPEDPQEKTVPFAHDVSGLEKLLSNPKVVGVGEVGLDRHTYYASRHGNGIEITEEVFAMQKKLFVLQIELAARHGKSLAIHNREAKDDLIALVDENKSIFQKLSGRTVLHCCEAEDDLLRLALEYGFYIGVDGDVTYDARKMDFTKKVPLESLVLETDSPYILPEPLKSQKKYPNTPATIPIIASKIADLLGKDVGEIEAVTTANAKKLFGV